MPDGTLEIGVQQLPLETLEVVLALLDPSALVKLHAATAASIPTIRKRLLAMRCARHWYQLTIRVPSPSAMLPFSTLDLVAASSSSHATTSADDTSEARSDASTLAAPIAQSHSLSTQHTDREDSGFDVQLDQDFEPCDTDAGGLQDSELSECSGSSSDREQSPTVLQPAARNRRQRVQWCPCSKQRLLECLYGQIQHINDVAALMFHMTLCKRFNFNIHRSALGLAEDNHPMTGMMGLETQVQKAFLLGYYCFVDFDTAKQHHATNGKCLKLSIKHTIKVLPGQSADPTVLQLHTTNATHRQRYAASRKEVPSDDVLVAFGQSEPYIQEVVSSLTDAQRAGMMLCVADMVDEFVGRSVA